jgi:hypothetical protein
MVTVKWIVKETVWEERNRFVLDVQTFLFSIVFEVLFHSEVLALKREWTQNIARVWNELCVV